MHATSTLTHGYPNHSPVLQLNAAIHRIAVTRVHYHPDASAFLQRRRAGGDNKAESIRALKRRLSDAVFRALIIDVEQVSFTGQPARLT